MSTLTRTLVDAPDLEALMAEIAADPGVPQTIVSAGYRGTELRLVFDAALDAAQEVALDAVLAAHDTLAAYATRVLLLVDTETRRRIAQGFEYPASSGKVFSLSLEAQTHWAALYTFRSFFSYPFTVRTMDDLQSHDLADATEVEAAALTGVGTVDAHLQGGRAIKAAVLAASDKAGVDAAAASWLAGS